MNENYAKSYVNIDKNLVTDRLSAKLFAATKFLFDRLVSIIGLIILSPIMLLIALAIKLDSKGPVLFKQQRTGKKGKLFNIYKFRTMSANNDVYDFSKSDEYTKIGKLLRKTSLDELPQLFSIAIGKMSFIGPRPWIPEYYENMDNNQKHRYDVRPGLTGLAQVMGRNRLTIFEKINYDLEYIENYSLIQDLKIFFLTIKTVFTCNGAEAGKSTIESELTDLKKNNNINRRGNKL